MKHVRPMVAAAASAAVMASLTGCAIVTSRPPACRAGSGLGLVAQAVPTATYLPCVSSLPQGWRATSLDVGDGRARFDLVSDRAAAPVVVELVRDCDVTGSTDTTFRASGVRTTILLRSIDPDYAGTLFDTFPGGCIRYAFDFVRGPHIALMEEFEGSLGLFARRDLAAALGQRLGVRFDP